jgi:glutathione S-transferase
VSDRPPRLFHFRVSHYNEKVRWALDHKGIAHQRVALVPGFHAPQVRLMTGQNKVPVLRMNGRVIHDSTAIIAELERVRPDPPLYPADPAARERALALEDFFDEEVAPNLRRIFWSKYLDRPSDCARMATMGFGDAARITWRALFAVARPALSRNIGLDRERVAHAHERLGGFFDRLESEIGPSGFLVGDAFSVADLTAAAVMTAIIRPPEFPYPLPEPWPPALVELRESVSHRAGFRWVLDTYARHRGRSAEIA